MPPGCVPEVEGSRIAFAWVGACFRNGFYLGSGYGHSGEGMSGRNLSWLEPIASALFLTTGHWAIGCDSNLTPDELIATGWLSRVNGVLVAPGVPTCKDKVLVYFVVSKSLEPHVVGCVVLADSIVKTHHAVRLLLDPSCGRPRVKKMIKPPMVPADLLESYTPKPDPAFDEAVDMVSVDLDAGFALWDDLARDQLYQLAPPTKQIYSNEYEFAWEKCSTPGRSPTCGRSLVAALCFRAHSRARLAYTLAKRARNTDSQAHTWTWQISSGTM